MKTKQSQNAVSYQFTPNGVEQCGYCSMFRPPQSCTEVLDPIDRHGWCQLYRPKTNPHERTGSVRIR